MSIEHAKLIELTGTNQENDLILKISKKTTELLGKERNIFISNHTALPTIIYQFLYCVADALNDIKSTDEDVSINFMNMLELGVTYRESDDGEKTGNFTPFVQPGTIFKTMIKSDEMTEDED